ncbi:MAG TPA: serine/threonine-protein kinase [Bryobacteraceae bacterium]|nr:serine/threonine-protein kinase [Bryobacteraceae bacterium]
MTPEKWTEVRQTLGEVLDLDPVERAAYISRLSISDPELHREVESLLSCETEADLLLPTDGIDLRGPDEPPATVGPWRILREAGRGGMGVVYEAERNDGQYVRRVAIKLLPAGFLKGALLRRFLAERQILAQLEHPGIARMIDGGVTDTGEPYLVMEYVDGKPLTTYARETGLNAAGKLRLFLDVCRAVTYAHGKLVVHRDLKPGNILVTREGAVKLLDFGLARILEPGTAPDVTQTAFRLLTPAYASPEQIRGMPFSVSGDVFSLGVVLYELLVDKRPFGADGASVSEVERAVCDQAPPSISGRDVPADLRTILGKTLEKEPENRYQSVEALASDVSNYLQGHPISARPPSWTYRSAKFIRRHPWGVAGTVAASLLVAAFAVIAAIQAERAQRRFDDVRQLATSLVFELHDEIARLPGSTKARELVVRQGLKYLDRLSRETDNDPSLLRQLAAGYIRLGDAQGKPSISNLGDTAGAVVTYRKALAILDQLHDRNPADPSIAADLGTALRNLTVTVSPPEDGVFAKRALQISQTLVAAYPGDARAQNDLAASLFNLGQSEAKAHDYTQSASLYRRALDIYRVLDRENRTELSAENVSHSLKRLGALALVSNDPATALADYQEAIAIDERLVASDQQDLRLRMDMSYGLSDLGTTLRRLNRNTEAADVYARAAALRREAFQADPSDSRARTALAAILVRQGDLLFTTGKTSEATSALEEAENLSKGLREYGQIEFHLAEAYEKAGRRDDASARRKSALKFFETARQRGPLMPNEQQMYARLSGR